MGDFSHSTTEPSIWNNHCLESSSENSAGTLSVHHLIHRNLLSCLYPVVLWWILSPCQLGCLVNLLNMFWVQDSYFATLMDSFREYAHMLYILYSFCVVCISGIDMFHRICSHQQSVFSKWISHCSEMVILGGCPSIHINLQHRRKMFY